MDSSAIVVGLGVAIITVLGTVVVALLRNSRKSPEQKDAQTNAWGTLNDRLNKHLDWLTTRVTDLEKAGASKDEKMSAMDKDLKALQAVVDGLRTLVTWQRARIAQLTKAFTDRNETPPEPPTPEPGT